MPKQISKKIYSILEDIEEFGSQEPTRLVVLKKWFQVSSRLKCFGILIAKKAAACRSSKRKGAEKELSIFARKLLQGADVYEPSINKRQARELCRKLQFYQNEHKKTRWAIVRIIKNWNLFLVEQGLRLFLSDDIDAMAGYKLASDYCKHYDPRYGGTLNAGSTYKLKEIIRFVHAVESHEGMQN